MMRELYQCDVCGARYTTNYALIDEETPYVSRAAHPLPSECTDDLCADCADRWRAGHAKLGELP
jgi:hypothetical protein